MFVLRWLMLLASAALMVLASGAAGGDEQPSGLRLAAAAAVGVLAPLFWPGRDASPARTLLRIGTWSLAAAAAAALLAWLLGRLPQPAAALRASSAMLLLMLWPAHAALALLERHWPRAAAGSALAATLVLAGMAPLVAGPAAELLERSRPGAIDAVVAASPLTHLALAGGNDLLRNEWFYRHAHLAALQFSYPGLPAVLAVYAGAGVLLTALLARRRAPRTAAAPNPTKEP